MKTIHKFKQGEDYILLDVNSGAVHIIDELIFDYGADTVGILIKSNWLLKFPFAYAKNYFNILKASLESIMPYKLIQPIINSRYCFAFSFIPLLPL